MVGITQEAGYLTNSETGKEAGERLLAVLANSETGRGRLSGAASWRIERASLCLSHTLVYTTRVYPGAYHPMYTLGIPTQGGIPPYVHP